MHESLFIRKTLEFSQNFHGPLIKKIYAFDDLASTNSMARSLALKGADEGTVVIAETQHEGRGRFDRLWESPKGGVYVSLLLRPRTPVEKTSLLAFVAALAVTQTVCSYIIPARIKWPNDVLVHGKKIAGILLESETRGTRVAHVIIGIGVNLNTALSQFSLDVQKHSTSLSNEHGSPLEYFEFLHTLFLQCDRYYRLFSNGSFERIIDEWKQHSDTLGKPLRVDTAGKIIEGVAVDVDQSGFLLVKTPKGKIVRVMSGDCTFSDES